MPDLVLHLAGHQASPNLMAVRHFDTQRHLFVATKETAPTVKRISQCETDCDIGTELISDPYQVENIAESICRLLPEDGTCVINCTGGTKPMFHAALRAIQSNECSDRCQLCYVNTVKKRVEYVLSGDVEDLEPTLRVDDFSHLAGHGIQNPGKWSDLQESRIDTTLRLWEVHHAMTHVQRDVAKRERYQENFGPEQYQDQRQEHCIEVAFVDGVGSLVIDGVSVPTAANWPDFHRFLAGGWFEEYCYLQVRPLLENHTLFDLRISFRPAWKQTKSEDKDDSGIQEIDIAYTDGFRLFVVECKSGNLEQGHFQKLENNVVKFGGEMACGILASRFFLNPRDERSTPVYQRIACSRRIACIHGKNVGTRLRALALDIKPGMVKS